MTLKPGGNFGKNGSIYVEVGPQGRVKNGFTTIADNKITPPARNPKSHWRLAKRTLNSKCK